MRVIVVRCVCVILVGLGIIGCGSDNTFVPPDAPSVTVQNPEQRDVTVFVGFAGRIEAKDTVEIKARVRGYLRSVDFKDGAMVEKGQRLFTIESEPYEAAVAAAEARLASTKAKAQLAETVFKRKTQAYKTQSISELDLLTSEAELDIAKADILQAEASLKDAMIELSYTDIKSPVAGRTSRKLSSVGNLVGDGASTLLTTVVVETPIEAYFNVDEQKVLDIFSANKVETDKQHKPRKVFLDLANGDRYPLEGIIDYADNVFNPDTGTINVRAEFANPNHTLLPGMFCRVLIPLLKENAVIIPDHAIQRDLAGAYVLMVSSDGDVSRTSVMPEMRVEDGGRIISGEIGAEDLIVVQGMQKARPGSKVKPEREKSEQSSKKTENGKKQES